MHNVIQFVKVMPAYASSHSLRRRRTRGPSLVAVALACFALSLAPTAFGVSPAPDGGYANFNTAEGEDALFSLTTGKFNTGIGFWALHNNTTGESNTAVGVNALTGNRAGIRNTATGIDALQSDSADNNTATGAYALSNNSSGTQNSAHGGFALTSNQTGSFNTATGFGALENNTADNNTATGINALLKNTSGTENSAHGGNALESNTTGSYNTATGFNALTSSFGTGNTAEGSAALYSNTTGNYNTAAGLNALYFNTTGDVNTATGVNALYSNSTGINNSADGVSALYHNVAGHDNAAAGYQALLNSKGSNNIGLGSNAGANLTTGSNNIEIGNMGVAGDTGVTRIGTSAQKKAFIGGISGKTVASGVGVIINSSGQLGTVQSSARFKAAIKPMDETSEGLLKLKPVTFRYKEELDPEKIPQFGLIAEEVEKVNPDLVVKDDDGKVTTVRYEAVNAMLLNEFLKEHQKAQIEERKVATLKATVSKQQKQIEALVAGLQKVNEQVALQQAAPQIVANRP